MAGIEHYDVCVVGAGIMGSAAARHAAEAAGKPRIALIGPSEHANKTKSDIHGAHYDEGRITHVQDPDPIWTKLAVRAMRRYRDLEQRTGIQFYTDVGCLSMGLPDGDFIHNITKQTRMHGFEPEELDYEALKSRFPYMKFPENTEGRFSRLHGGHVSPRRLVEAQKKAASEAGCDVIDDIVARVEPCIKHGNRLTTDRGRQLTASRVLLATGAFTGCRQLLPPTRQPKSKLCCETVLLVEVSGPTLERMREMPSVETEEACSFPAYSLPPIMYPDGKYYLKIGHGNLVNQSVESPQEIADWYSRGCDSKVNRHLLYMVKKCFPELPVLQYKWDRCVTTFNASGYPYVDMVTPGLGVAIGGCGSAAKCGDEIGKMAARMILKGEWDYDIPARHFRLLTTSSSNL